MFFYASAAVVLFFAGWACSKFSNSAGVSKSQVVATVGGHTITFGDWMTQLDLLRVFDTPVDPDNTQQVKAVLETLINQELIIEAAQKANFTDPTFDEMLKNKLTQADIRIKEQKEKLKKDLQAVENIENDYKEAYKKVLLARAFAANSVDKIPVTDKEMEVWYSQYSKQAAAAGQKMPPYAKIGADGKKEIKQNIGAEKFLDKLQADGKIDRNQDVIKKYLDSLSPSQQVLDKNMGSSAPAPAMPADKK